MDTDDSSSEYSEDKEIERYTIYSTITYYCNFGQSHNLKKMLERSEMKFDIFFNENELLCRAAINGGIEVVNLLIEYYVKHHLKNRDPESVEYEQANRLLCHSMYDAIDLAYRLPRVSEIMRPGVMELFTQYIKDNNMQSVIDDFERRSTERFSVETGSYYSDDLLASDDTVFTGDYDVILQGVVHEI